MILAEKEGLYLDLAFVMVNGWDRIVICQMMGVVGSTSPSEPGPDNVVASYRPAE
jgi:hypothetical protein